MTDTDPTVWHVKTRKHAQHAEIYLAQRAETHVNEDGQHATPVEWRWRLIAGNGRIIGASTEGYNERRKLVANLEACLHLTLLDQDHDVTGPDWYLYGVQLVYPAPLQWLDAGELSTGQPVRGVKIRVETPDPHWGSRVNRT